MTVSPIQALDISNLPREEDDRFEYKSSKIDFDPLKEKLGHAASGFWNSGGGTFVAGVDKTGKPDGGLRTKVGRTAIRDWADQVLMGVAPVGSYEIRLFERDPTSGLDIALDRCVLAVGFCESTRPPHMTPDNRYYLRAGAHTVPASHYLVEALWAKRSVQRPQLAHTMRLKPEVSGVIQLVVLALTDQPALNVSLSLNPLPSIWKDSADALPVKLPVLDRTMPFHLDITTFSAGLQRLGKDVQLQIEYEDLASNRYNYTATLDIRSVAPWSLGTPSSEEMAKSLESMDKALRGIPKALEEVRSEAAELRG